MSEQQILYFITLVEEKSFSKAAKKLYVTQPSFSQYIMKIEQQLGTRLFDRNSTPIKLTAEGEAVYEAVCEIRSINENLKNRIASLTNLQTGSLKIGTTPYRGATLLSKSIKQYHTEYPGISITILEKPMEELLATVLNGECDFAIGSGNINRTIFHVEQLATEQLYIAISPNNPLANSLKAYKITEQDIKEHSLTLLSVEPCPLNHFKHTPFVQYEGGENITELTSHILEEAGLQPVISLHSRDMYTVFSFVIADMGFSILPDTLIKYGNQKQHGDYYRIESEFATNSIYLISKQNRIFSKAALEYCRILKELIVSGTWRY